MNELQERDFDRFFNLMDSVAKKVIATIYEVDDGRLETVVSEQIQANLKASLDMVLEFSQGLMDSIGRVPMLSKSQVALESEIYSFIEPYVSYRNLSEAVPLVSARERQAEVAMELLVACFLTLYFLGVPFSQPWERVRRFVDQQGGFPVGGCMGKLIGDIYRGARVFNSDAGGRASPLELVWVLSANPSLFVPGLITRTDEDKLTPSVVHRLARCYALFQLRLYARAGFPFHYLVPVNAWRKAWIYVRQAHSGQKEPIAFDPEAAIEEAFETLGKVTRNANLHRVYVLRYTQLELGVPYCIVGPRSGAYNLDATVGDPKFGGNRISDRLLLAYRSELTQAPLEQAVQLVGVPQDRWPRSVFEGM